MPSFNFLIPFREVVGLVLSQRNEEFDLFFQPAKYSSTLDCCILLGVNNFENIRIMTSF